MGVTDPAERICYTGLDLGLALLGQYWVSLGNESQPGAQREVSPHRPTTLPCQLYSDQLFTRKLDEYSLKPAARVARGAARRSQSLGPLGSQPHPRDDSEWTQVSPDALE